MKTEMKTKEKIQQEIQKVRQKGGKIIWTNGCFDILHIGHIRYLNQAKKQGDILIVGLNSDESVKKIKGPERPIIPETERAEILKSLRCVDYVIIFDESSPIELLNYFKPDIYVKGGDYDIDTINQEERKLVESYGGEIKIISIGNSSSSSKIIEKIKTQNLKTNSAN